MLRRSSAAHSRGVSAVEYIIVLALLACTAIAGHKLFGAQVKCKVAIAINAFGGADSPACAEAGSGSSTVASNDPPPPSRCFVAGTLVVTDSGPRPIESLDVGVRVLARAEEGGELAWKPILRTYASHSRSLVRLRIAGGGRVETLEVTPNHRLRLADGEWLPAGQLAPGEDQLVDESGAPLELLEAESLPEQVPVYNLEVGDFHTYFVGELNVWAHNGPPEPPPPGIDAEPGPATPIPVTVIRPKKKKKRPVVVIPDAPIASPEPPPRPPTPVVAPPPPPVHSEPPSPVSPASPVSPVSPAHSEPPSPTSSEPESPSTPLLDGFNRQRFDHRMNTPGSIWDIDKAAAKIEKEKAERDALEAEVRRQEAAVRAAQNKLHKAKGRAQIEAAEEELEEAKTDRLLAKIKYEEIAQRKRLLDHYRATIGTQRIPPPDTPVGTVTIHVVANPDSAMSGHSWVSFTADPTADPAHLTFTMWRDAQEGRGTPLGFFANREQNGGGLGYGNNLPGIVLIPDPPGTRSPGTAQQSYPVTQSQLDSLLIYTDDTKNKDYNLCTHNCTSWATGAIQATGNTPPPARWMGSSWLGVDNPNSLNHNIKTQQAADSGGCG